MTGKPSTPMDKAASKATIIADIQKIADAALVFAVALTRHHGGAAPHLIRDMAWKSAEAFLEKLEGTIEGRLAEPEAMPEPGTTPEPGTRSSSQPEPIENPKFYVSVRREIYLDDAGDRKYVCAIDGSGNAHSQNLATWIVEQLNFALRTQLCQQQQEPTA